MKWDGKYKRTYPCKYKGNRKVNIIWMSLRERHLGMARLRCKRGTKKFYPSRRDEWSCANRRKMRGERENGGEGRE